MCKFWQVKQSRPIFRQVEQSIGTLCLTWSKSFSFYEHQSVYYAFRNIKFLYYNWVFLIGRKDRRLIFVVRILLMIRLLIYGLLGLLGRFDCYEGQLISKELLLWKRRPFFWRFSWPYSINSINFIVYLLQFKVRYHVCCQPCFK